MLKLRLALEGESTGGLSSCQTRESAVLAPGDGTVIGFDLMSCTFGRRVHVLAGVRHYEHVVMCRSASEPLRMR